jgi:hypothetical protein
VKSHSMKHLTPLLQGSYQRRKWQTVAGVITRRAWVSLQRSTYSSREKIIYVELLEAKYSGEVEHNLITDSKDE